MLCWEALLKGVEVRGGSFDVGGKKRLWMKGFRRGVWSATGGMVVDIRGSSQDLYLGSKRI